MEDRSSNLTGYYKSVKFLILPHFTLERFIYKNISLRLTFTVGYRKKIKMAKWNIKKIIPILGVILVLGGIILVISAVPMVQQDIWPYEEAVTKLAEKVPPVNATRMLAGIIITVAGFILLFWESITKRRRIKK